MGLSIGAVGVLVGGIAAENPNGIWRVVMLFGFVLIIAGNAGLRATAVRKRVSIGWAITSAIVFLAFLIGAIVISLNVNLPDGQRTGLYFVAFILFLVFEVVMWRSGLLQSGRGRS